MGCDQGLIQLGEVWIFQGNQMAQLEPIAYACVTRVYGEDSAGPDGVVARGWGTLSWGTL